MINRRKWRRWIQGIDNRIYMPVRIFTPIFRGYIDLLESNANIREPFHFHEWILHNHSQVLLLTLRKISDKDKRAYSLQRLLCDILNHNQSLSFRSYMHRCKPSFIDNYASYWHSIGGNADNIPESLIQNEMNNLAQLTKKACDAANQQIAHAERKGKYRIFPNDAIYFAIQSTLN